MKFKKWVLSSLITIFLSSCTDSTQLPPTSVPTWTPKPTGEVFLPTLTPIPQLEASASVPLPPKKHLYHGIYPGGITGAEDDITINDVLMYEAVAGKETTWVYFSNNWYTSKSFPSDTATWIRDAGKIPFIRLMLRSDFKFNGYEPVYTLQNIIDGIFDKDLQAWCREARDFRSPLLVEYGTEVNSDSFPWSGVANGGGTYNEYGDPSLPDGPERFQNAYRRIIQTCRDTGAGNITWVFHADSESYPDRFWNRFEYYYPGDQWIDWIGISIYGANTPNSPYFGYFPTSMDMMYSRIIDLAPRKPIIIAEFGTAKNNPFVNQVQWTQDALTDIISLKYDNLIGFSWWNEAWQNDSNPANDTSMRVQDNPEVEWLFKDLVGDNPLVIGEITP